MGCCLSSTDKSPLQTHPPPHFQASDESRAPPPVVVDEETVKEVLSETPIPPPPPPPPPPPLSPRHYHTSTTTQQPPPLQRPKPNPAFVVRPKQPEKPKWENATEIPDDVSEICSESVSAATNDDEVAAVVVQPRIVSRVSPRKLPRNGYGPGRVVGQSPTRRPDSSSPGRRNVNGVGATPLRSGQGHRSPVGSRVGSRDPGERSGRRSRSPATRVNDNRGGSVSRSGSANRRYPGRVDVESSGYLTRKRAEEPKPEEGKWAGDESLDNPLVSLECFIFL